MSKYIVILGTLDTKGAETEFLRQTIHDEGGKPFVVDTGVLGHPTVPADVSRQEVAKAAGSSIESLIESGDRARALVVMAEGAATILREMVAHGQLGGVLSLGGSRGTALSTRVMQTLPVGLPKLMVSTMASGLTPFGPYVGTRDVTIMHSVADILGINAITRPILTSAAVGIAAMARVYAPLQAGSDKVLAATMLGATTPLVEQIRSRVQRDGRQLIAFHATGTGGRAMEELVDDGLFHGVFDVSLSEVAGWLADGPFSAGAHRLEAAGRRGIPQVIVPGGIDFFIEGVPESIPERYAGRRTMKHTPTITLVRTSAEEERELAQHIATRLARSAGPIGLVLPRAGFSRFSLPGESLHDPEADAAFIEALLALLPTRCRLVELETDVNNVLVAEAAVRLMDEMMG